MQSITVFLQVDGVKGERTDDAGNLQRSKAPEITRGLESELVLKLSGPSGEPWEDLEEYAAWEFYAGDDWDPATPVLLAVTENITAAGNEVRIPVVHTNNLLLAAALGSSEKRSFHAELLGFASGQEAPALVVQFEIVVRNRVAASGTEVPEELPPAYLTAGSVRALVAEQTAAAAPGITAGGTWRVNGSDTGIAATGPQGPQGIQGIQGPQGPQGPPGEISVSTVTASTWTSSATYADFPYECALTISGVTATSEVDVVFEMAQAVSGNYAPVCGVSSGTVTIYSKVNTSISVKVRVL